MDKTFQKALEHFIDERLEHIGAEGSPELDMATVAVSQSLAQLRNSGADVKLINSLEDALSLQTGELLRHYYKSGFSDAISFTISLGAKL